MLKFMVHPIFQSISMMMIVNNMNISSNKNNLFHFYAVVYLYFLQRKVAVYEEGGYAFVCLELQQAYYPIKDDIWVNFTTTSHSAIGKNHFTVVTVKFKVLFFYSWKGL